jgi:hypothetical protein
MKEVVAEGPLSSTRRFEQFHCYGTLLVSMVNLLQKHGPVR